MITHTYKREKRGSKLICTVLDLLPLLPQVFLCLGLQPTSAMPTINWPGFSKLQFIIPRPPKTPLPPTQTLTPSYYAHKIPGENAQASAQCKFAWPQCIVILSSKLNLFSDLYYICTGFSHSCSTCSFSTLWESACSGLWLPCAATRPSWLSLGRLSSWCSYCWGGSSSLLVSYLFISNNQPLHKT